jgi:hypothetical protein
MPSQVSSEALNRLETNLSIQKRNATPAENAKATALELFARASSLDECIQYLKNPYTFEITTSDAQKVSARRQLAGMSVEVLETMRDELIRCGVRRWDEYEKLLSEG